MTAKKVPRQTSAHPHAEERRAPARTTAEKQTVSVRLSDPSARREVASLVRDATRTQQQARAFLVDAGLLTPGGRLPKRFGG